ncbi:FOG: Transposon-encoded proteins with TYA, reverse transcriptase, integrase domains in various combinations [Ceraceosorus bombacis]|uniref:FOG: Transposon-encoded proteins with TYA, reverse transcriptase, integrase domains in various combinations n=1 Tax=Ceraceosorus bombacis TaxID=401625 RepID=A0A0N7LBD9_9BASI|nr:FOG: Transposon-encoded proteins with TYA, reverse transcriptase, integrase domains in various combinations [Ceraceosorus bombacis]
MSQDNIRITRGRSHQTPEDASTQRSPSAPPLTRTAEASADVEDQGQQTLQEELLATSLNALKESIEQQHAKEVQHYKQENKELQSSINRLEKLLEQSMAMREPDTRTPRERRTPAGRSTDSPARRATPESDDSSNKTRLRVEDFPKYNGSAKGKNDVDTWLEEVTAIFEFSGARESQFLKLIPRLLEHGARDWFVDLKDQRYEMHTWDDWQEAFRLAFWAPNYLDGVHLELSRRRLRPDKPFASYFRDKLNLINKRYGSSIETSTKIEEIIFGMPTAMHPFIRTARTPDMTLEEFRRLLMELEDGLRAHTFGSQRNDRHQYGDSSNCCYEGNERAYTPRHHTPARQTTPALPSHQQENPRRDTTPRPFAPRAPAAPAPRYTGGTITCYRCGKVGHISCNCPSLPQQGPTSNAAVTQPIATNANATDLPYNRYQAPTVEGATDAEANVVTTRSKTKAFATSPEPLPDEELAVQDVSRSALSTPECPSSAKPQEPRPMRHLRITEPWHKPAANQPMYTAKVPATAKVWINGKRTGHHVCIDSGLSVSLIDKGYLEEHYPLVTPVPCTSFKVRGLGSGSQAWSYVSLDTAFVSDNRQLLVLNLRYYVSPFNHTKIILGNDALHTYGATISLEKNKLFFAAYPKETIHIAAEQAPPNDATGAPLRNTEKESYNVTIEEGEDIRQFKEALLEANINPELTPAQAQQLETVLVANRRAFAYGSRPIGSTDVVKFSVDTGDSPPISQPPYHASPAGRKIIEETIAEMLAQDLIKPCNSPWSSPVVLVSQGDKTRMCVDYRKLNAVTKKDVYPLPRIDDTLRVFSGKQWYTSLDTNKGFFQTMNATAEDCDKLAFRTHLGLYRPKRMPFGVVNGPSVFQRGMDITLGNSKWKHTIVYIDDTFTYSDTFEEHLRHLKDVLQRIIKTGMTLSLKKSNIAHTKIKALGHTISNIRIGTAPHNIEAVAKFPVPTNVKELQRFIGLAVYF